MTGEHLLGLRQSSRCKGVDFQVLQHAKQYLLLIQTVRPAHTDEGDRYRIESGLYVLCAADVGGPLDHGLRTEPQRALHDLPDHNAARWIEDVVESADL
jgi:hypothetical protein